LASLARRDGTATTLESNRDVLQRLRGTTVGVGDWCGPLFRRLETPPPGNASAELPAHLAARADLADYIAQRGMRIGLEIGVEYGKFASSLLTGVPKLDLYLALDPWGVGEAAADPSDPQRRVVHPASPSGEAIYQSAQERLAPYHDRLISMRMYSFEAVEWFEPESLDFVYVDAAHDYCNVFRELQQFWPVLRPGGLIAGHDFVTHDEMRALKTAYEPDSKQDWSRCRDGSLQPTAVKGAVLDFMRSVGIDPAVALHTTQERWPTWYLRKPGMPAA
jgi:hypothetical protein